MINLKTIKKYLFLAIFFLLPWQTRFILKNVEFSPYQTISIYLFDLVFILYFLFSFRDIFNKKPKAINKNLLLILSFLDFSVFFSLLFANNEILAIYAYLKFLLALGLFYISVLFLNKKAIIAYFLAIFINACLGIWQFWTQKTWASKYLGMAHHEASQPGDSVIETLNGRFLRAYGVLDHPNIFGGVLAISLLALTYFFIKEKKLKIYNFIIFYFVYFVLFLALFLSFSRSAWLGFSFGLFLFFVYATHKKLLRKQQRLLQILFGILLFFLLIFNNYANLLQVRTSAKLRLEQKSQNERLNSFLEAQKIIQKNWLYGVGAGNYTVYLEQEKPNQKKYSYQAPHNIFLLIWAENGIFAFAFFVLLLIFLIKNSPEEKIPILAGLLPLMLFDHWLWSLHFGILFLFFVFALSYHTNRS